VRLLVDYTLGSNASGGRRSAVDGDGLSGYPRGFFRSEVDTRVTDVGSRTESSCRNSLCDFRGNRALVFGDSGLIALHETKRECVGGYPVSSVLHCDVTHEGNACALASAIDRNTNVQTLGACSRGNSDDATPIALAHSIKHCLYAIEDAVEIDVDVWAPFIAWKVTEFHRAHRRRDTCVVHQNVDWIGTQDRSFNIGKVCNVEWKRPGHRTEFVGRSESAIGNEVVDVDDCARINECAGDSEANSLARASDEGGLSSEIEHGRILSPFRRQRCRKATYDAAVTSRSRSFAPDSSETVTLPSGQIAHRDHVAQSEIIARRFYEVTSGVWCFVGNGLSNQTFVEGPDGIIAIDTGESTEEMREAIVELRKVTSRPIVAVLYTHFHYVCGTEAVFEDAGSRDIPIWAHEKVSYNRERAVSEIAPAYGRGLAEQFAMFLPEDGPDGRVNVGLGHFYRNPSHFPFTSIFVVPTNTFGQSASLNIAGLPIEVTHAPSDSDDSVTYWFPTLKVAVNNLVWPVLFNVFAIRGEEYRDPRILLDGIDHLLSLGAEHLIATHGPPISGRELISDRVTKYRDSIQFLWDQSVRLSNRGVLSADIGLEVQLPPEADDDNLTSERYGVAEHHFRQIRTGLFGWFDGDEADLFPLPTVERARRLIEGFGGPATVREKADAALVSDDVRWALELSTWLVRSEDDDDDRRRLARCLRTVAQRTSAANIRIWCLTRALSLEGSIDSSRLYRHRFSRAQILGSFPERSVHILRVLVDPELAHGVNVRLGWDFGDGVSAGLHVRNSIACPTDATEAQIVVQCSLETWADVLTNRLALSDAITDGNIVIVGERSLAINALGIFDVDGLRS